MKLNGREIKGPKAAVLVLPRSGIGPGQDEDLVFMATAVMDYSDFEALCPVPVAPPIQKPGEPVSRNVEDPGFKTANREWSTNRVNWMILRSLQSTEGLEWEKVVMSDPHTWGLYTEELREAGLNNKEINLLINMALDVNGVDEEKMTEARKRFFEKHPDLRSG